MSSHVHTNILVALVMIQVLESFILPLFATFIRPGVAVMMQPL
jgi:hypothetical protein